MKEGLLDGATALSQRVALQAFSLWQRAASDLTFRGARLGLDLAARLDDVVPMELTTWPVTPRLRRLWRSAVEEYRRDLAELPPQSVRLDPTKLVDAARRALLGRPDEAALGTLERFRAALDAKLRHGAEVFAAPSSVPVGPTPRSLALETPALKLWRYDAGPAAAPRHTRPPARRGAPVLIVYSLINRPYVLDLMPGMSFVRHLLDEGLDVFLVEWKPGVPYDRAVTLPGVLLEDLPRCAAEMRALTGARRHSLVGHCLGGLFAALYASLHPRDVERLVALTTPYTSGDGGLVALLSDPALFPLDAILARHGLMPGKLIRFSFLVMKPYYELMRWKSFLDTLPNDAAHRFFLTADTWLNDNPDLPGELFRGLIREVYFEDRLRRGATTIGGRPARLAAIRCPVLNVWAEKDWVVPPASARAGTALFGGGAREESLPGYHLTFLFDPRLKETWKGLSGFLLEGGGRRPARRRRVSSAGDRA